MFDTIIRNGTIIDGTKRPRYQADVGIEGDRVTAIGNLADAKSRTTIDAPGQVVTPGFIDVHNHSDGWLLNTPHLTPKTLQGFTTEILMVDGISYAPVNEHTAYHWLFYLRSLNGLRMDEYRGWRTWEDYMQLLDRSTVQNSAAHLPYANIRAMACGFGDCRVDDFQMRQIQYEIRRGMEAGAVGLSTGLDYIVQCYSTTDELVEACQAMAEYGGVYVTHVRYKKGLLPAIREAIEIGRRAGVAVHISHLKQQPPYACDEIFTLFEEASREIDISYDAYPYQPGSTMLNYFLPYEAWSDGPLAAMGRLTSPETRTRFREGINAFRLDLDAIRIAWVGSKENAMHEGKTLAEYVAESGKDAADALLELLLEERLAVLCVMEEGDDALIWPILQHDLYMMGTDGIYMPGGQVHPRMFGSAGRLVGPLVRDQKLFTLEDAVAKLTSKPAGRFKLVDRGVVRENAFADLVVFDPETIADQATLDDPLRPTVGISSALVNGELIIRDGAPIEIDSAGAKPGRFLRFNR